MIRCPFSLEKMRYAADSGMLIYHSKPHGTGLTVVGDDAQSIYSFRAAEVEYVVNTVLENREEGMQLKEQAVLFRGAHHSDRLELELVRRNIPYVKYGGAEVSASSTR